MRSKTIRYATLGLGLLLLTAGLYLFKTGHAAAAPASVCVGLGCGLFGHGMGAVIRERAVARDPNLKKKMEIEKNDERSAAIANRAKGGAFDIMTFVFGALMVSFALMQIDTAAVLLIVFAYLFVHGCAVYDRLKLEKEM